MSGSRPEPPYVAVIFSNRLRPDAEGYAEVAERMVAMARAQPGYLGHESARGEDGFGITISYWADEASSRAWREVAEHAEAQRLGRERFYAQYDLRVAVVLRQAAFGGAP